MDSSVPPCYAASMPTAVIDITYPRAGGTAQGAPAGGIALAVMAGLASSVAAVLLGRTLLRRTQWQRNIGMIGQRQAQEQASLLGSAPDQRSTQRGRRARLAALLRDTVGAGLQSRTIEMVPLAALPGALAHRMVPHAPGGNGLASSGPVASLGSIEVQQLPLRAGPPRSMLVDDWVSETASQSLAGQHNPGNGCNGGRQWRLDTHSLRLESNELEVRRAGCCWWGPQAWPCGVRMRQAWLHRAPTAWCAPPSPPLLAPAACPVCD